MDVALPIILAVVSLGGWFVGFFLLARISFRLSLRSSAGFAVVAGFLSAALCARLAYHDPGAGAPEPGWIPLLRILSLSGGYMIALGSIIHRRLQRSHEQKA